MGYISDKLQNRKAASDLYDDISLVLDHLADSPEMFPLSDNRGLSELGIRKINIRGYNHYYQFTGDRIYIVRFVSTLRDQHSEVFTDSTLSELTRP